MTRKQALILVSILLIGWGSAAAVAILTDRTGVATLLFIATLVVFFCYPFGGTDRE